MDFEVGQKIVVDYPLAFGSLKRDFYGYNKKFEGLTGTVIGSSFSRSEDRVFYAVKMDTKISGHSCSGLDPSNNSYWIIGEFLRPCYMKEYTLKEYTYEEML